MIGEEAERLVPRSEHHADRAEAELRKAGPPRAGLLHALYRITRPDTPGESRSGPSISELLAADAALRLENETRAALVEGLFRAKAINGDTALDVEDIEDLDALEGMAARIGARRRERQERQP